MSMKYVVLAMEACPLEVDEIRRILRRRNLLEELYYRPHGATYIDEFNAKGDFFDHQPSAISAVVYSGPLLVINPSPKFEQNESRIQYLRTQHLHVHPDQSPMTIIHGNSRKIPGTSTDIHPPALLQLCANIGEFPERRHQLIARFARNCYYLGDDVAKSEEDWLFSRNYRLQGITSEQEEQMRDAWAIRHTQATRIVTSPIDNCTPFYDYFARGVHDPFHLNIVCAPERMYVLGRRGTMTWFMQYFRDRPEGKPLSERLISQRDRSVVKFDGSAWSDYYENHTYPGGLPLPSRVISDPDRVRYLEFFRGPSAASTDDTLSLIESFVATLKF